MLRISFDLDGTLLQYPQQFIDFARFMQLMGHSVGILSGEHKSHIEQMVLPLLFNLGWTPTFYIGRDETDSDSDEEEINHVWKPKMINEYNIDIHFDDHADLIGETQAKIVKII